MARAISVFLTLSVGAFLLPFANSWGRFPLSQLWVSTAYFVTVLMLQCGILYLGARLVSKEAYWLGLPLILLLSNLLFFTFFASSWTTTEAVIYAVVFCFVFIVAVRQRGKPTVAIVFLALQLGSSAAWNLWIELGKGNSPKGVSNAADSPGRAGRSVYVIGMDSLVSRHAMKELFGQQQSPAYSWLEENGFELYDALSPGDQTLTTFGSLLAGTSSVHPRTVRRLFNGTENSRLYRVLAASGFKRQFFFENDYFGVGPGYIEDFKPIGYSWNFCKFTDRRWGFYFCEALNRFLTSSNEQPQDLERRIQFYMNNVRIEPGSRWFSISHIWYPGHTIGDYDGADSRQRAAFINYYANADKNLITLFARLLQYIRQREPLAVVIFMGDHGAHVLRSTHSFTLDGYSVSDMPSLKTLDTRSVLWAVSPKSFCNEQIKNLKHSSQFLLRVAACASEPE